MSETDILQFGDPMPRIGSVEAREGFIVRITWIAPSASEVCIDLGPVVLSYKFFRPLRDNPDLFRTVHVANNGRAVAWGATDEIDMSAETLEHLASEMMEHVEFRSWLGRNQLTLDAAAAQLGISRRLAAYYASGERCIPRYIALACAYLDMKFRSSEDRGGGLTATWGSQFVPNGTFASSVCQQAALVNGTLMSGGAPVRVPSGKLLLDRGLMICGPLQWGAGPAPTPVFLRGKGR